jgi:tricorn protease
MWIGDKIFFSSDRDGTLNLYSYDITSDSVTQLTRSTTWDVRWPSSDNESRIVYELNGELQIFEVASGQDQKISINVPDDGVSMRPSRYSAEKNIEDFELSPKGERALFVARGDIFTAPIEKGPTRNLTNSSNAHDKWARWSPDGKKIAFISDMTGEDEVYVVDQDGSSKPEQLTRGGKGMRYQPEWSPDGNRIAFSDKDGKIFVLTIETKDLVEIAEEKQGLVRDYQWSPKGGYLAFSLADPTGFDSIYIWSVVDGQLSRVTDGMFDEFNPAWDPEGNFLYYISRREYAPQISDIEWNYAGNRSHGIFALALRKDVENPFPPESDEVTVEEDKEDEVKDDKNKEAEKTEDKKDEEGYIQIDFDGLAERALRVPIEADNYGGLSAKKGHILYGRQGAFFYGRQSYAKTALMIFSMEDRKASALAEDVANYAISPDGSKVLVRQGPNFNLYDAKPGAKEKKTVSTKGLMVDRVPSQEWLAIFDEAWRQYRDFFYVENMHGYDWEALREQYRPWVKHVAHRSDLNYVLGEMVAELNVGHTYIQGGDFEIPERPKVGLPGARFELDESAGRYKIAKIFKGQNEEDRYRSPLTELGVDAKVGDYVLAIDGVDLRGSDNPYRLLQHKTHTVTLTLNSEPKVEGSREVTYKPITSEQSLLYYNWVQHNYDYVTKATDGRVGYLHIPDMGSNGIREFIKWYYPQIRKEGMVIDVRSNGGGNVSQWIIERLDSKLLGTRFGRMRDDPGTYPATVFHGHLVCLLDETSASDGDIFPYYFRESGLGPLIGKRSWGGVVGISGRGPLIDGGQVFVPQSGSNAPNGAWVMEGHGVDPDIVVDNDPASVIAGKDPQLDRGIEEVLKAMKAKPMKLPARPPDPVKTK